MVSKVVSYQRLLLATAGTSIRWTLWWLVFIPLASIQSAFSCFDSGSAFFITVMLTMIALTLLDGNGNPLVRTVPVSDRFAVANMLFAYPLLWAVGVALGVGIVLFLLTLTGFFFGATGAEILTELTGTFLPAGIETIFGILFCVLLTAGLWFLLCITVFQRGKWAKRISRLGVVVLYFALLLLLSALVKGQGYTGYYRLSDVPALLPAAPVLLAAALLALCSGIFAWFCCLRLYRSDVSGQRSAPAVKETELEQYDPNTAPKLKYGLIIGLVLGAAILGVVLTLLFGSGISNDSGEPVHIETHSVSDYAAWQDYQRQSGVPADLYYTDSGLLLFPETVQPETVTEYYASLDGSYSGDEWASLTWKRLLAVALPEEDYHAERQRIAGLSLTHLGQTNGTLYDTEHFAWEAYLAVYNAQTGTYEYALFSNADRQIIYVFGEDISDSKLPMLQSAPSAVIPIAQSNDQDRGYSIYSFWNEEDGTCETWWPD